MYELAHYRAMLPNVGTLKGARACHHFWDTGEGEGHVGMRWVGCFCSACWDHDFATCKHQGYFSIPGEQGSRNEAQIVFLPATSANERTRKDELQKSLVVSAHAT